jgi:TRAP-type mannitol/chloroaromatic compound transport system permease small subunit
MRRAFCLFIERMNEKIARACGLLLSVAILIAAGNALMRFIFHITSAAALEWQNDLFSAAFMLAGAHVLGRGEHIRIDVVHQHLAPRTQKNVMLFGHIFFTLPICLVMMITGSLYAIHSYLSHETSISPGGLIIWPAKALIPLSFILLGLEVVALILRHGDDRND